MIQKNPAPDLDMEGQYYISHLMRLSSETNNGSIPILKIYEYCRYWDIDNPLYFGEIISWSSEYVSSQIRKQQEKKNG